MQLLIKLYSDSLKSFSATLPANIRNRYQFELTLKDLKKYIHSTFKSPFNFEPKYQIIYIGTREGKLMRIDGLRDLTILDELGVQNGSLIHLLDQRLVKRASKK